MYDLVVNGTTMSLDVPADTPLLWALRDNCQLTGTKFGCGIGLCGACTVHIDGRAVRSCVLAVEDAKGHEIRTIEGVADNAVAVRVRKAWLDLEVIQCGYCQPGQIMSAVALLTQISKPNDSQIDAAMSGNICRCGTYPRIRKAIHLAAE
jgi:isoquinoline 1-oxidoreductase alpha subunit